MAATAKRHIEVFTAGCRLCDEAVQLVHRLACGSCEVEVLDKQEALESFPLSTKRPHEPTGDRAKSGGPHGIRTHDLRVANAALSQLS